MCLSIFIADVVVALCLIFFLISLNYRMILNLIRGLIILAVIYLAYKIGIINYPIKLRDAY